MKKSTILISIGIILLGIAGYLYYKKVTTPPTTTTTTPTTTTTTPTTTTTTPTTTTTTTPPPTTTTSASTPTYTVTLINYGQCVAYVKYTDPANGCAYSQTILPAPVTSPTTTTIQTCGGILYVYANDDVTLIGQYTITGNTTINVNNTCVSTTTTTTPPPTTTTSSPTTTTSTPTTTTTTPTTASSPPPTTTTSAVPVQCPVTQQQIQQACNGNYQCPAGTGTTPQVIPLFFGTQPGTVNGQPIQTFQCNGVTYANLQQSIIGLPSYLCPCLVYLPINGVNMGGYLGIQVILNNPTNQNLVFAWFITNTQCGGSYVGYYNSVGVSPSSAQTMTVGINIQYVLCPSYQPQAFGTVGYENIITINPPSHTSSSGLVGGQYTLWLWDYYIFWNYYLNNKPLSLTVPGYGNYTLTITNNCSQSITYYSSRNYDGGTLSPGQTLTYNGVVDFEWIEFVIGGQSYFYIFIKGQLYNALFYNPPLPQCISISIS
ncbi:hypothetical protein SBV1_gp21 [Sulfolobales Beppu virus 1]|nr:hypothetical protein SBV1_gp21 [Sulfolobales Beppu virus 1]